MTISHHPNIATLMAFSAGSMDEPYTAVIATHLAMSEGGRETAKRMDAIGGALLADEAPAGLAQGALERLMRSLSDERVEIMPPDERSGLPAPLQAYLPNGLDSVHWKWTGPGVATVDLAYSRDHRSRLMLLRVAAGRKVPEHGHGGQELTLILQGAYKDRFGVFGPGDIADHDEDIEHQPIAEPGDDCICLAAVDARLTFRGRIMRTLQPLFGL